ncbi:MAG: MarR family transcriptional regulator, partial [Pseudomonadota bacterium]
MIEAGGRTAQSFGLNRLFGQIYILLYLSDEACSLDLLAEQLGVSKASVSIACRQLETWGAVHRSWVKGDRRDYYVAETNFNNILRNGLLDS